MVKYKYRGVDDSTFDKLPPSHYAIRLVEEWLYRYKFAFWVDWYVEDHHDEMIIVFHKSYGKMALLYEHKIDCRYYPAITKQDVIGNIPEEFFA